jgi:hypothetical protein
VGVFSQNAPHASMTAARRADRSTDELIGVCRGVLADGHCSSDEAGYLKSWIERNSAFANKFPYDVLYRRLTDALVDGVIDSDEESDLLGTLSRFVGGETFNTEAEVASLSSALPLDEPAPLLLFRDAIVVVTGTFAFGRRAAVIDALEQRGAHAISAPTKRTRYLVIGKIGSRDWIHSSYGRKIERAVELKREGVPLAIVSEDHWAASL